MPRGRKCAPVILTHLQGKPKKPDYLDDIASKEWERVINLLDASGNLSTLDGAALEVYCTNYAQWRTCQAKLNESLTDTTPNGYAIQSAYWNMSKQAEKVMLSILNTFGGNPRSRKAIKQTEKQPEPTGRWKAGALPAVR